MTSVAESPEEQRPVAAEDQQSSAGEATALPATCAKDHVEHDSSEAEGNMATDTEHLQKQAKGSWMPGDGEEILVGAPEE